MNRPANGAEMSAGRLPLFQDDSDYPAYARTPVRALPP
jgi:hypothetical protein